MFLEFSPIILLLLVFLSSFVPGAILSLSLFRKEEHMPLLDKVFIGFALGIIIVPTIPFLLYLVLGVKFTYSLALASVAVMYIIALGAFVLSQIGEGTGFRLSLPAFNVNEVSSTFLKKDVLLSVAILFLVVVAFWIRLGSYSPVFQELDPYYYTYVSQQLITLGENPLNDKTSWYPELEVDHRAVPALSYLEAIWYYLYAGGSGAYNNMLLAVIASCYPPIMAALAVFFVSLFLSANYDRKWGIIAAGIASFVPMFLYKTVAGEMEIQPYAFFALAFFLALYAWLLKKHDMRLAVLAGIAYFGLSLGSSSEIVVTSALILFVPAYALMLYLREEGGEALKDFLISNAVIVAIGPLFGTAITKSIFVAHHIVFGTTVALIGVICFVAVLWLLKLRVRREQSVPVLAAFFIVALIIFLVTPLGEQVKSIAASGIGIVSFDTALKRTVAEQNPAGTMLAQQIGFIAESYPVAISSVLSPLAAAKSTSGLVTLLGEIFAAVFGIVSAMVNLFFALSVKLLNSFLGMDITWEDKGNGMLLLWIFLFIAAVVFSLKRSLKDKVPSHAILYAAVILPPVLVGIMKAKYTIYAGFLLAAGIGVVFGEFDGTISAFTRKISESIKERRKQSAFYSVFYYTFHYLLLLLAVFLLFMQFVHQGFSSSLFFESFKPRFQDAPMALQAKFKSFCSKLQLSGSYDADICGAAQNPLGYANKSTNNQYSQKLCIYSLASDTTKLTSSEQQAASLRCQRLSPYWVESMEWIRYNTENDSRTTSWWDYGHWINYFGQKNTVLRNEHLSLEMIGEVAHAYIDGSAQELAYFMKNHDSKYALFDMELITGGNTLGGKYGALNYLSCVRDNGTNVSKNPGQSLCEMEHLWEQVYIPVDSQGRATGESCRIAKDKTGVKVYHVSMLQYHGSFADTPYYPGQCQGESLLDPRNVAVCQQNVRAVPVYCLGGVLMADGSKTVGFYYLNETYANGDLKLNKGQMALPNTISGTYHFSGNVMSATVFYTKNRIWLENGELKDGYEDRKGKFYDSNLYKGLFLNEIEGFTHMFSTSDNQVKIYKLKE